MATTTTIAFHKVGWFTLWCMFIVELFGTSCSSAFFVIPHQPIRTRASLGHILSSQSDSFDQTESKVSTSITTASSSSSISTSRQQQLILLQLQDAVQELKQVLSEEYSSMFNPMRREFYAADVTFDDPLTTLRGIDAYQANVDLLGSRTWLGAILFQNANIVLHSIQGGDVVISNKAPSTTTTPATTTSSQPPNNSDNLRVEITDITTRWTLSMTFQALPWKPTARFTGISVYRVEPTIAINNISNNDAVQQRQPQQPLVRILRQQDYWDSINLIQGGHYQKVSPLLGLQDLLQQLLTIKQDSTIDDSKNNKSDSSQLPYQLLRRAKTYQIRRYPSFKALVVDDPRADDDGALSTAMQSLRKAGIKNSIRPVLSKIICNDKNINNNNSNKDTPTRTWWIPLPLGTPTEPLCDLQLVTVPSQVVAVAQCALEETNVAQLDQQLREALRYDGVIVDQDDAKGEESQFLLAHDFDLCGGGSTSITHNMKEIWITLRNGCHHPWSN